MTRIDAIGAENREDIRALSKELARTRLALATCQSRCWVRNERSDRAREMVAPWVSALAATAALFLSALSMWR